MPRPAVMLYPGLWLAEMPGSSSPARMPPGAIATSVPNWCCRQADSSSPSGWHGWPGPKRCARRATVARSASCHSACVRRVRRAVGVGRPMLRVLAGHHEEQRPRDTILGGQGAPGAERADRCARGRVPARIHRGAEHGFGQGRRLPPAAQRRPHLIAGLAQPRVPHQAGRPGVTTVTGGDQPPQRPQGQRIPAAVASRSRQPGQQRHHDRGQHGGAAASRRCRPGSRLRHTSLSGSSNTACESAAPAS